LSERKTVKATAAVACVTAWIIVAVTQLVITLGLPDKVVAFGLDLTHSNHMSLVRQAAYIACGLALAIASWANKKWQFPLVIVSSLFYLLHWFPWRLVGSYGFTATAKLMYQVGSIPELRFTSSIRDIALPIVFAAVIVLATLERRRHPAP
jgi:hypothetical protein